MKPSKNGNTQNGQAGAAGQTVNGGAQTAQSNATGLATPRYNARKSTNLQGQKDEENGSKQMAQVLSSHQDSDSKGSHLKDTAATPSNASKSNPGSALGLSSNTSFAISMTPNRNSNHKNGKYGKHYESNPAPSGHVHMHGSQRQSASTVLSAVNAPGQPQHYLSIQLKSLQIQASKLEMQLEQSN